MDANIVETLLKKYNVSKDQKYQIRYKDGNISEPLSVEGITAGIINQKFSAQDEISTYPKEDFKPLASDPFFYELLYSILQKTELTEIQKEEITRVLDSDEIPKKIKKKAVKPSKVVPKIKPLVTQTHTLPSPHVQKSRREKKKTSKRRKFFIYSFFLFFLLSILLLLFTTDEEPKKVSASLSHREYITVKLPAETTDNRNAVSANALYEKALAVYQKDTIRAYMEALKLLQDALFSSPTDVSSLSLLAKSYIALWDLSRKDADFLKNIETLVERALTIDPSHLGALQSKALWLIKKNDFPEAKKIIEQIVAQNRFNGESFLIEGEFFILQKKYEKAITSIEKTLELSPSLARCHYLLGKIYQKKNSPEKAYEVFWIGLNLHPEHALSRLEASLIDIQTFNNLTKAEGNLKIVAQFPSLLTQTQLSRAHYHLGWIYEEEKRLDYALKDYKKAYELEPSNEIYAAAFKRLGGDSAFLRLPTDLKVNEESLYFLNIGNRYLDDDRLVDAIAQYKVALQIDAKNYLAHYQLGQIEEKKRKLKNALEQYQKALQIKASHVDSYVAMAKIYIHYFNFEKAIEYIEKVKSIEPRSAKIYILSGFYHFQKGNNEKAISEYQKAAQLAPENFEAQFELGYLSRLRKEYKEAEKYFLRALRIKPQAIKVQTEVALLYYERGLKSQAVEHLKKLSAAYPLNPAYLNGLANLYLLNGNIELAKQRYLKAHEADSKDSDSLEGLAQIYIQEDEFEKALETYKKIIQIDPTNAKWYFKRGNIQLQSGNLHQALSEFKLASQINYKYPLVHYYAGKTALILNQHRLAETELKKEISINPHLKEPYMLLGDLYSRTKQYPKAQKNYQMYIRLEPESALAYIKLGRIHQYQGRFETAIEFFKTAIEKDSDQANAFLQLGFIYRHLERKSDGIEAFQHYLRISPDAENAAQVRYIIKQLKKY